VTHLRVVIVLTSLALCVLLAPADALALDTSTRSADEIRQRWTELQPTYVGAPYATVPGVSAPYSAGALQQSFFQDGLNSIN
ncbi:MAG TPA: hypothetical protein VIL79_01290, partial [Thermoleophilia bacterium]